MNKTMPSDTIETGTVTLTKKILSAVFFAGSTIQLVVMTKYVISLRYVYVPYQVFGVTQLLAAIIFFWTARFFNLLQFPSLDKKIANRIYPLLILYCGSIATNIEHFGIMSNSMFNMSRGLVILITITMVLERILLEIRMSGLVKLTVGSMVLGAMIGGTGSNYISFSDHCIILLNYSFTAGTRVYLKKILNSRELGVNGLMYYSTIVMLIPPLILVYAFKLWDIAYFSIDWTSSLFWFHLFLTSVMGTMISWSAILCIHYNGALTTSIVGNLVNTLIIVISYIEALNVEHDVEYADNENNNFSWRFCVGWSIIVCANLMYVCNIFKPNSNNTSMNALQTKERSSV